MSVQVFVGTLSFYRYKSCCKLMEMLTELRVERLVVVEAGVQFGIHEGYVILDEDNLVVESRIWHFKTGFHIVHL